MQLLFSRQDFPYLLRLDLPFSAQNKQKLYYYFYFQYLCNNCVLDRILLRFRDRSFPFQRKISKNCILIFIFNIYAIIVCKTGFSFVFKAGASLFSANLTQLYFCFFLAIFIQLFC